MELCTHGLDCLSLNVPEGIMIQIYDTTLRDGTQREGISLSLRRQAAHRPQAGRAGRRLHRRRLARLQPQGRRVLRARPATWPGKHALIAAFGSTCRVGGRPARTTPTSSALLEAETPVCTVVGKTWTLHVDRGAAHHPARRTCASSSRAWPTCAAQGRRVIYDAEHFFDGYKADPAYALETLQAAVARRRRDAGAVRHQRRHAALGDHRDRPGGVKPPCDTRSASTPTTTASAPWPIRWPPSTQARSRCRARSTATASAAATPTCAPSSPTWSSSWACSCLPEGRLTSLSEVSHFVAEVANLAPGRAPGLRRASRLRPQGRHPRRGHAPHRALLPAHRPDAGRQPDARRRLRALRARQPAEQGRRATAWRCPTASSVTDVLERDQEPGSAGLLLRSRRGLGRADAQAPGARLYQPPFELIDFSVDGRTPPGTRHLRRGHRSRCASTAKSCTPPPRATARSTPWTPPCARRSARATRSSQPSTWPITRSASWTANNGTGATTRVLIDTQNGTKRWSTVGASANIIEASWRALADSVEYGLTIDR